MSCLSRCSARRHAHVGEPHSDTLYAPAQIPNQRSDCRCGAPSSLTSVPGTDTTSTVAARWRKACLLSGLRTTWQRSGECDGLWPGAIQAARHGAHEGDIFSPAISLEFKQVLALEMNAETWAVIMDDNPGEFPNEINGIYPDGKPYSTVPERFSRVLPALPDDVEYPLPGTASHPARCARGRDSRPDPLRHPVHGL